MNEVCFFMNTRQLHVLYNVLKIIIKLLLFLIMSRHFFSFEELMKHNVKMSWLKIQLIVVKYIYYFRSNLINEKNTTQQWFYLGWKDTSTVFLVVILFKKWKKKILLTLLHFKVFVSRYTDLNVKNVFCFQ